LIDFVEGLADDAEAVVNGCTEPWSNGMVEGFINKVKWIKREPLWTSRISITSASCEARTLLPEQHIAKTKHWPLNKL